jgi:hypothetical protein
MRLQTTSNYPGDFGKMTVIPSNAIGTDDRGNLVRSILLMSSVCAAYPTTAANSAKGTPATVNFAGITTHKTAFLAAQKGDKVMLQAELPMNAKLFNSFADAEKAILPVAKTATPVWAGTPQTGTTTVSNLEEFLYKSAKAVSASLGSGETLTIAPAYNKSASMVLQVTGEILFALADLSPSGSGY